MPVLATCDMLARTSRGNDLWGREVLKVLSLGLPVLAPGHYDTFVQHGATGLLFADFDAGEMAGAVVGLADDPMLHWSMGEATRARVATLCHGAERASHLAAVWRGVVGTSR